MNRHHENLITIIDDFFSFNALSDSVEAINDLINSLMEHNVNENFEVKYLQSAVFEGQKVVNFLCQIESLNSIRKKTEKDDIMKNRIKELEGKILESQKFIENME